MKPRAVYAVREGSRHEGDVFTTSRTCHSSLYGSRRDHYSTFHATQHCAPTRMMRWPWSSTTTSSSDDNKDNRAATALARFTDSEVLLPTAILTGTTLGGFYVYKRYLRRIPSINYIKPNYYRKRSLFGTVVSVGDADNFRIFHTPGGRLTGWGWLPGRSIPRTSKEYASKTVRLRKSSIS